jgi:hypothetical protein
VDTSLVEESHDSQDRERLNYLACRPVARQGPRTNKATATARQQLRKYATVLEPLLGSDRRATMEVLLETVFSMRPLREKVHL